MNLNDIKNIAYIFVSIYICITKVHPLKKSVNRNHTYTVLRGQKGSSPAQKQEQSSTGRKKDSPSFLVRTQSMKGCRPIVC